MALDARSTGNEGRFARSGCRPNAILRPMLCRRNNNKGRRSRHSPSSANAERSPDLEKPTSSKGKEREHGPNGVRAPTYVSGDDDSSSASESETDTLSFAIYALRDLKANEEVVLGWEWDDGSVVHELPAIVRLALGLDLDRGVSKGEGPSEIT